MSFNRSPAWYRGIALVAYAAMIVAWMTFLPAAENLQIDDVITESIYLIVVVIGYLFVVRLGYGMLELGWGVFLWAVSIDVLDEFTSEPALLDTLLQGALEVSGLALVAAGFYLSDRTLRRDLDRARVVAQQLTDAEQRQRDLTARLRVLLAELDHRVKNNLSALLSLVSIYAKSKQDVNQFADALRQKLLALKAIHEEAALAPGKANDLRGLMTRLAGELVSVDGALSQIRMDGPSLAIGPRQTGPLAMVIQELLANAAKYGALSDPAGVIEVKWSVDDRSDGNGLPVRIEWIESRGPASAPPSNTGVGHQLIRGFMRYELSGQCAFHFESTGLRCVLDCKIDRPAQTDDREATKRSPADTLGD